MHTASTRHLVILTIYSLIIYFKKTYCFPRRDTILHFLAYWHKRFIGLSDLDYHLGILKKDGLITSNRNYGRRDDGTVYGKASNRQIPLDGLKYLKEMGVNVAKYLWARIHKEKPAKDSLYKNNNLPQQDLDKRSDSGFEKISLPIIDEPP